MIYNAMNNLFTGTQNFYLVDEARHCQKGAYTVTSLLHHLFEYKGYGESNLQLHMDNCVGQNKNNTVIRYAVCFQFFNLFVTVGKLIEYPKL